MGLVKVFKVVEKELGFLGMVLILSIAFFTSADVFCRYVLSSPIPGVPELGAMLFMIGVFLNLSYTQAEKAHIRVGLISNFLPRRVLNVTEFIVLVLTLLVVVLLTWKTAIIAMHSVSIREVKFGAIPMPIWPAKLSYPIGVFLLGLRLIIDVYNHVRYSKEKHEYDTNPPPQRKK